MRVAFATMTGENVEGQFRRTPRLVVYEVTETGSRLERTCPFVDGSHRSQDRIQAIADASMVFVAAIGPSIAARLASRGIRPATVPEGTPIRDVLTALERSAQEAIL